MEFYNQAARAIDQVDNKRGSLKSIVFNLAANKNAKIKPPPADSSAKTIQARQVSDGKRLLRVVAETLRYRQVIESILRVVDILSLEPKAFGSSSKSSKTSSSKQAERWQHPRPHSLVLVLVHDHLFASRGISMAKIHKIRAAIERHSSALKAELSRLMVQNAVSQVSDLVNCLQTGRDSLDEDSGTKNLNAPRWIRVNTIKWSIEDARAWFIDAGWNQVSLQELTKLTSSSPDQLLSFAEDEHVAGLLALPSTVVLAKLKPYLDGRLIAQDKASCMPAQLLLGDYPKNRPIEVIDATAAPGNKTTMLSSIVGLSGKVWAFEKDKQRFRVLQEMIKLAGCTNVQCINGDFLAVDHSDARFQNVSHIMVDPSCSGSGISNRLDHLSQTGSKNTQDEGRIQSLSRFQTTIVSHALRFPSVQEVVYSTCSIWKEENEEVVFRILNKPEMINKGWTLKDVENTFLANSKTPWRRSVDVIFPDQKLLSDRMVRFDPSVDQTIGFFAAVFLRPAPQNSKKEDESQFDLPAQIPEPARTRRDQRSVISRQTTVTATKKEIREKKSSLFNGIRPGRLIS
ncbi:hypothetical protein PTTG_25200 [Puccinia triticina 1-1 BBBD Race 1]|uniref:SAM_MT_RSMB_NOP domain-containing protein n=1 Tax=Puccinia triticina (isolate 1-1 / race 1 (BBBD)) TaxID=630390 RepID=A0A180H711_PUCT1|nr:hypothetical protein PTTG_25200 [Puccinia triticina 1-1 BBBD Race 1]